MLLHQPIDYHAQRRPTHPALAAHDHHWDYATLVSRSHAVAQLLLEAGVKPEDRVGVLGLNSAAHFAVVLGASRVGAVTVSVNFRLAPAELAFILDDAGIDLLFVTDDSINDIVDQTIALRDKATRLIADRESAYRTLAQVMSQDVEPYTHGAYVDERSPALQLYTSGTTGKPKGVQRDTGGYAVALATSMETIFMGQPGETYFSTSDIGWVVGHSYIVYGPLLAGMATILYEGIPIRPDAGVWWELVQKYRVTAMFSAPTAIRVLKKYDTSFIQNHDLSSLKALFLAGEPLDEPTSRWIAQSLGRPIIDNYWQTETGWPILTVCQGIEPAQTRLGSPGKPVYGFDVQLLSEVDGAELHEPDQKGVLVIKGPLPPGAMQTVWQDDERFVNTYWRSVPGQEVYSTFDWGVRDADGYFYILGRTDDVINVAGHRLGTREIEESIASHAQVAEVAVVGVADSLKGQVAMAFAVLKDPGSAQDPAQALALEGELMKLVEQQLGAVARPARIRFVTLLPKTRSGKLLRRAIQALCEGRDPGDLTTIDDPSALDQIRQHLGPAPTNE